MIGEVNTLVTKAVLELPLTSINSPYLQLLLQQLKKLAPVLQNYIRNPQSQQDCLNSIEDAALAHISIAGSLVKILHHFYDTEMLSEESILLWHKKQPDANQDDSADRILLRKKIQGFITWLEEAEEDSSEEGSEE